MGMYVIYHFVRSMGKATSGGSFINSVLPKSTEKAEIVKASQLRVNIMASIQNYLGPRTKVNRFTFLKKKKKWVAEGISGNILYMIGKAPEKRETV
jgi:hypothetical protein